MTAYFIPNRIRPTGEQLDLQTATQPVVLGEANAGAAKTTTLALRIAESIARKVDPARILALAFTPEARDVLRQRLQDIGVPWETVAQVDILTIEELAIRSLGQLEGGEVKLTLQPRRLKAHVWSAIDTVAERYVGRYDALDLRKSDIAVSAFLDALLRLKAGMKLASDYYGEDDPVEAAELAGVPLTDWLVAQAYESARLDGEERAVFRTAFDPTYDLARSLQRSPDCAGVFPRYRVVVCDELHDMNEASFVIVEALIRASGAFFTGVGDKHQVIHNQLGASHAFLDTRFKQAFPALRAYPLTTTYRHGPHLTMAITQLMDNNGTSGVAEHTEIRQLHYDGTGDCARQVVVAIKQWKDDKYRLEDCAILMRDRHQSVAIENALIAANIAYRTPVMKGYMQREEILFLRGVLAIALADFQAVKSYEVRTAIVEALAVFSGMEAADGFEKVKYDLAKEPQLLVGFFQGHLGGDALAGSGTAFADVMRYLLAVPADSPAGEVLREVAARMDLAAVAKRVYVNPHEASVVTRSVQGFIDTAGESGLGLAAFWQKINAAEVFATRKRDKNFVFLDIVADVKGKEFGHVIMPYLEQGEFPDPAMPPKTERNLFYVGVSRTRQRLTLISPTQPERRSAYLRQMQIAAVAPKADHALRQIEDTAVVDGVQRTYLTARYEDRDEVRQLGAQYDPVRKKWFIQSGQDTAPFRRWLN